MQKLKFSYRFDHSNVMESILSLRKNIFLGFARRTAPDFDYNSGSACSQGQVGPVTKMQKMMKIPILNLNP